MASKKVQAAKSDKIVAGKEIKEKKKLTDFERMKKNWAQAKKGSTYVNPNTGEVKETSDFMRGKAAGKAEELQKKIDIYNFKKGNTDKIRNTGFLAWLKRMFGGDSE